MLLYLVAGDEEARGEEERGEARGGEEWRGEERRGEEREGIGREGGNATCNYDNDMRARSGRERGTVIME